jgi:hypothetical protein
MNQAPPGVTSRTAGDLDRNDATTSPADAGPGISQASRVM